MCGVFVYLWMRRRGQGLQREYELPLFISYATLVMTTLIGLKSNQASSLSAQYSFEGLKLEEAPALTISCHFSSKEKINGYTALTPENPYIYVDEDNPSQATGIEGVSCRIDNFGKQPILNVELPLKFSFSKKHPRTDVSEPVLKNISAFFRGIPSGSSFTLKIWNGDRDQNLLLYNPEEIYFNLPSTPDEKILYNFPRAGAQDARRRFML
jgi:hypothetical protein